MEKYYEEWDGKKFPVREIQLPEELGGYNANVADIDLWDAIENAYNIMFHPDHNEAAGIDNDIYFYCDYGFIASDPTGKEIVDYLIKHGC